MKDVTRDTGNVLRKGVRDAKQASFGPFVYMQSETPVSIIRTVGIWIGDYGVSLNFIVRT